MMIQNFGKELLRTNKVYNLAEFFFFFIFIIERSYNFFSCWVYCSSSIIELLCTFIESKVWPFLVRCSKVHPCFLVTYGWSKRSSTTLVFFDSCYKMASFVDWKLQYSRDCSIKGRWHCFFLELALFLVRNFEL